MEEVKNMTKPKILGNERGGIAVMVMSLIAMVFCITVFVVVLDYIMLYKDQNKIKNDLNRAVHAASLSIDELQLSKGFLRLDTTTPGTRAQDMFYRYLRSNMGLDDTNKAIESSVIPLNTTVNINELLYVDWESRVLVNMNSSPTSCTLDSSIYKVSCEVTLNGGTATQITRTINQTVIGPSVVAIISTFHEGVGSMNNEPLLIPAVQEVIFRKR
ncbi:hypothetical protein BK120_23225 [Paenibacillus sp. FSL A5-0031]|uniref:hypothetical protein n=1 Tax=Paenibacillus sp. FSL A5-0031 TaxID=1920420 RepID=UPI00096C30D1|nr:hypothetical protein [Paenibacillus sp. FSL A5-0031]OME78654.1 hypothetical protein BK120_23225 [Paenibacillus sp. FSL A5-0031]